MGEGPDLLVGAFDSARQLTRLIEVTHGISDFPGPELDDTDGRERCNLVLGQLGHPSHRLGRQRLLDRPHRFACFGEITSAAGLPQLRVGKPEHEERAPLIRHRPRLALG